ncbi:enoyl-CoA hydratase/isomerase family protein [Mycobacterium sp. CBMA271]|uniref:enoyl-CoA hydratase/isomerase family protein n=1 Tax=unclassified Mycobacteroides TaxID=2618759 RepID=UPI0012DBE47F|nr:MULTISPECIES: enoyl-CoA hydratase/isomerase family protein [unclassified Mycobacteroides]MUM20077.1 enoyl-CoA hydratase [Mycobacteroides sp. CBMA 326]MUM24344.1 enoyl-CoA hydratase/isomerase family protein [Mycobacteroides sp. CBMA 271]
MGTELPELTGLRCELTDRVLTVRIDHGPLNLLDGALMSSLSRLARWLVDREDVRVVLFGSANPDFFIAHLNVEILQTDSARTAESVESFQRLVGRFRALRQVTIALVEGRVAGGGSELLLNLDMRFAVRGKATFNQVETGLGIVPAGSGPQHLVQTMGRARALEVILGHEDFDADLAERYGWVNRALDPDEGWRFVERLARRIAVNPLELIAGAKSTVDALAVDLEPGLAAERTAIVAAFSDPHSTHRIDTFLTRGGQTVDGERRLGDLVGDP